MPPEDGPFSKDAAPVNQSGRLTEEQAQRWRNIAKRRRQEVRGVAYVFGAMALILLFVNPADAKAAARANGRVIFLAIAAILFVAASREPVNADVREGRVESVEGAIAKTSRFSSPRRGFRRYYFTIAGRRLQVTTRTEYDAAPDAGHVRAYFFPRSRRVVNLEHLADPPIPTGPHAAQEVLGDFARALLSGDRSSRAEAAAGVAALEHVTEGPPSANAGGRAQSSRLRADDLYGVWTNPMVTVTLMKSGIATLETGFGAIRREGHWSVDAGGRLLADISGQMEPIEASLEGRRLTIVIEGQRMAFTRGS